MAETFLAIDTSGQIGRVALARGDAPPTERVLTEARRHTAELMPTIQQLLAEHGCHARELTCFAFTRGPGSFTGLRMAATIARMLRSAVGCAVVGLPTLEVLAAQARELIAGDAALRTRWIVPVLDARRGQAYAAAYALTADGALECHRDVANVDLAEFLRSLPVAAVVLGEGLERFRATAEAVGAHVLSEPNWSVRASTVLELGRARFRAGNTSTDAETLPLYVRPPECEEVYEQRRAEAKARRGN